MRNLAFAHVGSCFVLVQNEHTASDEEWTRWVEAVSRGGADAAGLVRVLVMSAGGSPTPKQRRQIHALMPATGGGVPTAVVIGSTIGRAVVTAMSFFNGKVRAFAPEALGEAFEHLEVPRASRPELFALAKSLHAELGIAFVARL
jgi:hypothetical protein